MNSETETGVVFLEEDGKSEDRVEAALKCLPKYDAASSCKADSSSFHYWKIRDYAYSYRSKITTPSLVGSQQILALPSSLISSRKKPTFRN